MKKLLSILLFGVAAISLTGCYTQFAVQENDDSYVYSEPVPVIVYYPVPGPILILEPLPNPPQQPVYKTRKPVAPPPRNVRKRDDIRNSGGRNEGGRRSRR